MSLIQLSDARLRNIPLPSDDGAAQDIIDEEEAWLARKIGPLTGSRVETFYVAQSFTRGKLGLKRYTDAAAVEDGGVSLSSSTDFRLIDEGSAVVLTGLPAAPYWRGPYVTATYTPTDALEVQRAVYALLALAATPEAGLLQETIGDYSYTTGVSFPREQRRAAIASGVLPKRDQLLTMTPPYIFAMEGIAQP